jgi:hypothetical protein
MKVEFIFDNDCPNVVQTRENLMKAFSQCEISAKWQEWDRGDESAPIYVKKLGSPTILVNGEDIEGRNIKAEGSSCRYYGGTGIPSVEMISFKMKNANKQLHRSKFVMAFSNLSLGPGVGSAILAKAFCPLCYPAIAAFLSSIGLGFIFKGTYFLIIMGIFFSISLFGLWYRAKSRRGFAPFYLGLIGTVFSFLGRIYNYKLIFYTGIGILIGASIWNLIPKKQGECTTCKNIGDSYEKNRSI